MGLKNEYHIIDLSDAGFPFFEVRGESFCHHDLYELIGQHGLMATFDIKSGSTSHSEFGESLTGIIFYAPNETKEFSNNDKLKILCFYPHDLKPETLEELKYGGLNIDDIESISFMPLKKEAELHETGEKKVPNIIPIKIGENETKGIDFNKLQQSLLVIKNNDGVILTSFEKEELVGLTLALNKRHIDLRILNHLGFNKETAAANINVQNIYYNARKRLGTLSDDETQRHAEIKDIIRIERVTKLLQEIKKSDAKAEELEAKKDNLKEIFDAVSSFQSHVLLVGKRQVYWDVDSYIHIAMRHFQKYQLGSFTTKTSFSYKVKELESLIEQVLKTIKEEYQSHVARRPKSIFTRQGKMAIEFNGDHYAVQIDSDGRLVRFHAYEKDVPKLSP